MPGHESGARPGPVAWTLARSGDGDGLLVRAHSVSAGCAAGSMAGARDRHAGGCHAGVPADGGIGFAADGSVIVGPEFRPLEAAWIEGVAAMARAGARVIVDEVFLGGADSQQRWQKALGGLRVLWVGVRCDGAVAAGREVARGDRTIGMAAAQAEPVHQGVAYDLEVDTTRAESMDCARTVAAHLG